MKTKTVKRMLALLLATMTMAFSACGKTPANNENVKGSTEVSESVAASETKKEEHVETEETIDIAKLPVLTMYHPTGVATPSGMMTGYRAEIFAKSGFQLELWAYSDEKTNAILASGDMPDIMYVPVDKIPTMVEAGMLLNLEDYLDQIPHLYTSEYMEGALEHVRENRSGGTGELYGLPIQVGTNVAIVSIADSTGKSGLKLRWDVYDAIGRPEINDYWDLIDVMEQMVKEQPETEEGAKTFGTVLNAGRDSVYWGNMKGWFEWQGYGVEELKHLIELDKANGTYTSILSEDSKYYEGLKWYNAVYRRGLMDPDSMNLDRVTQQSKRAMVPSGTLQGAAPSYFEYYIPGTNVYYDYTTEIGADTHIVAINANTEHLEECLTLLDLWCNPDAIFEIYNGPEGDIWYSEGEDAYLTEKFLNYIKETGSPSKYLFDSGEEFITSSFNFCLQYGERTSFGDGNGGKRVCIAIRWDEFQDIFFKSDNLTSWQEMNGYRSFKDLLEDKNALYTSSIFDKALKNFPDPDDKMQLTIDTLRDTIVTASWKMVYAESDEEFQKIWNAMVSDCEGLGAQTVIDWASKNIDAAIK